MKFWFVYFGYYILEYCSRGKLYIVCCAAFHEHNHGALSSFTVCSGNAKDLVKKVYLLDQVFFQSRRAFFQSHIAYGYTIGVFSREVKGISVKNLSIFIVSEVHTFLTSTSS